MVMASARTYTIGAMRRDGGATSHHGRSGAVAAQWPLSDDSKAHTGFRFWPITDHDPAVIRRRYISGVISCARREDSSMLWRWP
jgi:hypothetical protein